MLEIDSKSRHSFATWLGNMLLASCCQKVIRECLEGHFQLYSEALVYDLPTQHTPVSSLQLAILTVSYVFEP